MAAEGRSRCSCSDNSDRDSNGNTQRRRQLHTAAVTHRSAPSTMSRPCTRVPHKLLTATAAAVGCASLLLHPSSLLLLPVAGAGAASMCLSSHCLLASTGFTTVYPHYLPDEIGFDYSVTLFRFFIALVCILVAVWLARWYMDFRGVAELWAAVRDGRVIRIPPEWASARSSITREVLSAWMARQEQPTIVPTPVGQIRVPVHLTMAAAKLQLAPSSMGASGLASPSGALLSPSPSPGPNPSPSPGPSPSPSLSPSSSAAPPGLEYALRLVLSSTEEHACLVEVYLGVEMKKVVQLISAYDKVRLTGAL